MFEKTRLESPPVAAPAAVSRGPGRGELFSQVKETFELLRTSTHLGVPGVLHLDSGKPGPQVGIGIMTHGNEPGGLAALKMCLRGDYLKGRITHGSVTFMLQNIAAAERFFSMPDADEADLERCRFLEENMNRLPPEIIEGTAASSVEGRRLRELLPVYAGLDFGLDIHSTSADPTGMIIQVKGDTRNLLRALPYDVVIEGIVDVQRNKPASAFFGGAGRSIPTLGIECGVHYSPEAMRSAFEATIAFIQNCGILNDEPESRPTAGPHTHKIYRVTHSVLFPNKELRLVEAFAGFPRIVKGQVLARGGGEEILSPIDGHALLGFKTLHPFNLADEAAFLSEPVQEVTIL